MRFLLSTALTAVALARFLDWSQVQVEGRIDQMQEAAFNTPGAESPLPPMVLAAGMGLLAGHFLLGRILGLKPWHRVLSLVPALTVGALIFQAGQSPDGR